MADLKDIAGETPKHEVKALETGKAELLSMEIEAKKMELESKKLQLLEQKANLQDLQERLDERELKRETKRQRSITNGATLTSLAAADIMVQGRCTHRKGGEGAAGVIGGQGQASQYAVLKHTFANGDMWIRCLRCGKTWKPPVHSDFVKDGIFNEAKYVTKMAEYQAAVNFQTLNVSSKACLFKFSDNGEYYREITKSSTLR